MFWSRTAADGSSLYNPSMSSANMGLLPGCLDLVLKDGVDKVALPFASWCLEGSLKPFHQDLRSRLLGGETADDSWVGAAGVEGVCWWWC